MQIRLIPLFSNGNMLDNKKTREEKPMVEELDQALELKIQHLRIRNILEIVAEFVDELQQPEEFGLSEKAIWWLEFQLRDLHNQLPL